MFRLIPADFGRIWLESGNEKEKEKEVVIGASTQVGCGCGGLGATPMLPRAAHALWGCVLDILDPLGHARFCCEFVVLLEELVRKALL